MPYGTMSAVELSLTDDHGQGRTSTTGASARRGRFGALRAHVDAGPGHRASRSRASWATSSPGRGPAASRDDERILFWHRGLATTDIALGQAILDRAVEQDVGTLLPYR